MPPTVVIPGVAMATSYALDRLERAQVNSTTIALALVGWQQVAAMPLAQLSGEHNDWTRIIGPGYRDELQRALAALPARRGAGLRAVVARADAVFCAKTLPDPHADPTATWWWRRSRP